MIIRKLWIKNFRNLPSVQFEPNSSLNFFLGTNGQGKTSILEAIGYLSTLRSFRNAKNESLIQEFQTISEIGCVISSHDETNLWETTLKVLFDASEKRIKRRAFINDTAFASSSKYLEQKFKNQEFAQALGVHAIVFNPSDHEIIQGEPKNRRKYLDQLLCGQSKNYLVGLKRFEKLLEQRNAYLKSLERHRRPDRHLLDGLTTQLALEASQLTYARLKLLEELYLKHPETMQKIAPFQQSLEIGYSSSWMSVKQNSLNKNKDLASIHFSGQGCLPSIEELESDFKKACESFELAEIQLGRTLVGPQRDDWGFWVKSKDEDNSLPSLHSLKAYGSQGEVRSALLALKLCEIQLYRDATKLRPILLIDDFSSELDIERRHCLLKLLSETDLQVFVTSTDSVTNGLKTVEEQMETNNQVQNPIVFSRWSVCKGEVTPEEGVESQVNTKTNIENNHGESSERL